MRRPANSAVIRTLCADDAAAVASLLAGEASRDPAIVRAAARIVSDVRADGDAAMLRYAQKHDDLRGALEVTRAEMRAAAARLPRETRAAIHSAIRHVARVAVRQVPADFTVQTAPGVRITQRITPLARAGCYVPAGRHPLLSSLIMSAVPARAAGVREVVAVCPRPDDGVMAAALDAGVTRLFRVGGAHAIAALAFGTETIPRVDRIVGPGNAYVAAAKTLVQDVCAVDFQAGPSEILVMSDAGLPEWIAADLVAQAEHDPHARAIFVTTRRALAASVATEIARALNRLERDAPLQAATARASLSARGAIVIARTFEEAVALTNRVAPEHAVCDDGRAATRLTTAGTIFVGRWSAQAAGDYTTGSNHILPTGGAARVRGGLSAADFVKITSVQTLSRAGLNVVGRDAIALAEAEGLSAHAASIRMRLTSNRKTPRR